VFLLIMDRVNLTRASALPAIAAALVLTSTSAAAQQAPATDTSVDPPTASVQPVQSVQSVQSAQPTDAQPQATDANSPPPMTGNAPDVSASLPVSESQVKSAPVSRHLKQPARATTASQVRPDRANFASRDLSGTRAATAAQEPQRGSPTSASVKPKINLASTATAPQPAVRRAATKHDNTVPIAAGGVLALLAIGSAAAAVNRRRPDEEQEEWTGENEIDPMADAGDVHDERLAPSTADEEQPVIVTPPLSAFRWSSNPSQDDRGSDEPLVEKDDRQTGETWVQRAYRGPSPLNPSVSLKTRLKRAAFFDKRERDAAAGRAEPVDPSAGLPERMIEDQDNEFA